MTPSLHLRIALILASVLVSSGCASHQEVVKVRQQDTISSAGAVRIAKEEIRKRGSVIKSDWIAKVEDSLVEHEFIPPRQIFTVSFYRERLGARSAIYRVNIDKQLAKVKASSTCGLLSQSDEEEIV
jgi:hypothetical protein